MMQFMKTVIKSICMYVMIFLPKSLGTRIIFTCLYEDLIFPVGSEGKESTCNPGDRYSIPGSGRSPDKGMATHSMKTTLGGGSITFPWFSSSSSHQIFSAILYGLFFLALVFWTVAKTYTPWMLVFHRPCTLLSFSSSYSPGTISRPLDAFPASDIIKI